VELKSKRVAAVAPPVADQNAAGDIPRLLLGELRRVGCSRGINDDNWNVGAQRSLRLFNENAKTAFDTQVASLEALGAVRSKKGRVCPLICERGFEAKGEDCVEKTAPSKREKPVAKLTPPNDSPNAAPEGDRCSRMRDVVGCNCALKTGGYIYPNPRSNNHTGYSFRWTNSSAYSMCLHAAGRR
jgi:hypothetical protein